MLVSNRTPIFLAALVGLIASSETATNSSGGAGGGEHSR